MVFDGLLMLFLAVGVPEAEKSYLSALFLAGNYVDFSPALR